MIDRRSFFVASATLAVSSSMDLAGAAQRPQPADLETMLEVCKVPGLSMAGIQNGREWAECAGVCDKTRPAAVTTTTYFPAASLSKVVFAWQVRKLARSGQLDLQRPLAEYAELGLSGDAARITATHVLTHSTGLVNWRFQPDEELRCVFPPGSRWRYSGEGYVLLQRTVEKITGKPIAGYLRDEVLLPMGMRASTYIGSESIYAAAAAGHDNRGEPAEHPAISYDRSSLEAMHKAGVDPATTTADEIMKRMQAAKEPMLTVGVVPNVAGSMWTTAPDYARFLARTIADVTQHRGEYAPRMQVNRRLSWSLGWGVDSSLAAPALFHWGDTSGYKNLAWVEPGGKRAAVLLTNGDHGLSLYSWALRSRMGNDPAALYWI